MRHSRGRSNIEWTWTDGMMRSASEMTLVKYNVATRDRDIWRFMIRDVPMGRSDSELQAVL